MCKVSFWILFIWVCLFISITLDLVLRQFRFSLRVFNLNSHFFLRDYVKAVLYYFVSLWSFLSLCLDSLHVFYSFAGFRFCQRSKYKHVRHCDSNFNQIVQFNIIILCKYPKVNMHILHTVLDITSMITDRIGLHEVLLPINYKKYNLREEKYNKVMKERENLH